MQKYLLAHVLLLIFILNACGNTEVESNIDIQNELEAEADNGEYKLMEESYETTMETININLTDGIATVTNFENDEYSLFMVIELEIENMGREVRTVPIYDVSVITNSGHEINVGQDGFPLNINTEINGDTTTTGDFRVKLPKETLETIEYVDLTIPSIEGTDGSKVSNENETRIYFSEN